MEIEKRLFTFLIACCAGSSITASAQQATAFRPYTLQADVTGITAAGNNSWSVAGTTEGTGPNVMSELKWKKQVYVGAGANIVVYPFGHWLISASYSKMGTAGGTATDRDYAGDNRTGNTYAGNFTANRGYLQALYTGIGYTFLLKNVNVTAATGYTSTSQLNFLLPADVYTPSDLSSTYKIQWKGWAAGVETAITVTDKLQVVPGIQYRQLNYYGEGNWNLIPTFRHPRSFDHKAKGYGLQLQLQGSYAFTDSFGVLAAIAANYAATGHGAETLYLQDGGTAGTRLNAAYNCTGYLRIGFYVSCK